MASPRVRRLESDYKRISERFECWPIISVEHTEGFPPDKYRIGYNLKGLFAAADGQILERDEHILEIQLGLEYPRRAPQLRLLTPLFHPNFNSSDVCAQDIYAASEGLDDLIIRIGRMIAYQEYNTKSPLNGIAARWAAENSHKLPVDAREISPVAQEDQQPQLPQPDNNVESSWEEQIVIGEGEEVIAAKEEIIADQPLSDVTTEFDCPGCGTRLEISTTHIGKQVQCPSCDVSFQVPGDVCLPPPAVTGIRFACSYCQQKLEGDETMIGLRVVCPACNNEITVAG